MRIGYARVSKADGSESLDLQRDGYCQVDSTEATASELALCASFGEITLLFGHSVGCLRNIVSKPKATRSST